MHRHLERDVQAACVDTGLGGHLCGDPRRPVESGITLGAREGEHMRDGACSIEQLRFESREANLVGLGLEDLVRGAGLQEGGAAGGQRRLAARLPYRVGGLERHRPLTGGRALSAWQLIPYIVVQVLGAITAAFLLRFIASGQAGFTLADNRLAVNGYGDLSPGRYSMLAGFVTEVVMTAMFLFVILGGTDKRASSVSAGLAIGLALTLIHLISIPVTNTSVNPARSTGPALALLIGGQGQALGRQLWLFWVAPIIGAVVGALAHKSVGGEGSS